MECSALAPPVPDLKVADRCDRCSAQALKRYVNGSQILDFCGHHSTEHAPALWSQGFVPAKAVTL